MQPLVLNQQPTHAYAMEWLSKAIALEAAGKARQCEMALTRACRIELATLGFEQYTIQAAA